MAQFITLFFVFPFIPTFQIILIWINISTKSKFIKYIRGITLVSFILVSCLSIYALFNSNSKESIPIESLGLFHGVWWYILHLIFRVKKLDNTLFYSIIGGLNFIIATYSYQIKSFIKYIFNIPSNLDSNLLFLLILVYLILFLLPLKLLDLYYKPSIATK